jgi:hypothetical protein
MLAGLLFVAAAIALIAVLLFALVVAGIRQEPANAEMTSRARRPTPALARFLLGVYVRRPNPAEDTDAHQCSCLADQGSEGDGR